MKSHIFCQCGPVSGTGGVEHSEKNHDNTGGESEIKPELSATNDKGKILMKNVCFIRC